MWRGGGGRRGERKRRDRYCTYNIYIYVIGSEKCAKWQNNIFSFHIRLLKNSVCSIFYSH